MLKPSGPHILLNAGTGLVLTVNQLPRQPVGQSNISVTVNRLFTAEAGSSASQLNGPLAYNQAFTFMDPGLASGGNYITVQPLNSGVLMALTSPGNPANPAPGPAEGQLLTAGPFNANSHQLWVLEESRFSTGLVTRHWIRNVANGYILYVQGSGVGKDPPVAGVGFISDASQQEVPIANKDWILIPA